MENEELKEPKIGEVVAVQIEDLMVPIIVDLAANNYDDDFREYDVDRFQHCFDICELEDIYNIEIEFERNKFKDNVLKYVTLLRYEGNGVFTELYTNEKIAFRVRYSHPNINSKFVKNYIFEDKYGENVDMDCAEFLKLYEELEKVSLYINKWHPLTDEVKHRILYQEYESDKLKKVILYLMQYAKDNLKEGKKHTVVDDFDVAHGEKRIYDFIHNSDLATTNQSDEEKPKQRVKQ